MKTAAFLLPWVIFWCLLPEANAATWHWEFAGWYGGGCFPNIVFDPKVPNRIYLTSDVAGVYRSDDLGEHWYFVTHGLADLTVAQVAIAPTNSNIIYAATNGGLYFSTNAGASWSLTDTREGQINFMRPDNYRPIVISSRSASKLCVGTAKGKVYCSTNAGQSWTDVDPQRKYFPSQLPIAALGFDARERLYVASADGLKRCASRMCSTLGAPSKVTDLVFSKNSRNTLYVAGDTALWSSPNAGASWNKTWPIPSGTGNIYRIALDETRSPAILRVLWADGWRGGVLSSFDGGLTWQSQDHLIANTGLNPTRTWQPPGGRSTSLAINPFNPNVIFRTDWWGVFRSDDGGTTWREKINGAANTVITDIAFASNSDLYVASMDNGLLRSRNGGKTYEQAFPKSFDNATVGHVWRALVSADKTVIGTSSPWNMNSSQVILSSDRGNNFTLIRNGLPAVNPSQNAIWDEGYPRALAADPQNPNNLFLGIDGTDGGGLFMSLNQGLTWQRTPGQPGSLQVYRGLKVDPTDSNRIIWGACDGNGGIYISEDGGNTFTHSFKYMPSVFDVAVDPNGVIYAAGDAAGAKLYASSDHGRTWKMVGDFGAGQALSTVAIDPRDPQHLTVGTVIWHNKAPGRVFMSNDGGKTWEEVTGDLPNGAGISVLTFDLQGKYLYAGRYASGVYRLTGQI